MGLMIILINFTSTLIRTTSANSIGYVFASTEVLFDWNVVWSSPESDWTSATAWGDMDGDGDLDLAVANIYQPTQIYRAENETLNLFWSSAEVGNGQDIAWGDMDDDGDLDLAVGGVPINLIYENQEGEFVLTWSSPEGDITRAIAWGDVDGDGDLDLAVGNTGVNRLYRNNGGALTLAWSSAEADNTFSLAWGDVDRDNDLDLVVGNYGLTANRLYLNNSGTLALSWSSAEEEDTTSVAWGDIDGDSDLDLAVGNYNAQPNRLYLNTEGNLDLAWTAPLADTTYSVAWGDADGDGDLDLAVGNNLQPNYVYENDSGVLSLAWASAESDYTWNIIWGDVNQDGYLDLSVGNYKQFNRIYMNRTVGVELAWSTPTANSTTSLAWGDIDNDGDPDLAVGNYNAQPNQLYQNNNGNLSLVWSSPQLDSTNDLAWGDMDADGDLDLAVANYNQPNRIYANTNNQLALVWSSAETDFSTSVAWGDADGDGDLDVFFGNFDQPNRLYQNQQGQFSLTYSSPESDATYSVAWGDMDNDGDLDLAIGNRDQPNRIYRNIDGELVLFWVSYEQAITRSIAWGDMDNDGDLDLLAGNDNSQPNHLYRNDSNTFVLVWSSPELMSTHDVEWVDWNNDGDMDLVVGNRFGPSQLYQNSGGNLSLIWETNEIDLNTSDLSLGDFDQDGDFDILAGNNGFANNLYVNLTQEIKQSVLLAPYATLTNFDSATSSPYGTAEIYEDILTIPYRLYGTVGQEAQEIRGYYSLNGRDWQTAVATSNTITTQVAASPSGANHTFEWDISASHFFGSSDAVIFRLAVIGELNGANTFPYSHVTNAYSPQPFRVRGTQVRVVDEESEPIAGAIVYRLPLGQPSGGYVLDEPNSQRFITNAGGYLLGRGALAAGDGLVALSPAPNPITFTDKIESYYTSAAPTPNGLALHPVDALGVQTLTISEDNQLFLLNLVISLEWDASQDPDYVARLEQDIRRASEVFFDLTNGQMALGEVTIYQNREQWENADVVIYASNMQRPSANLGGLVTQPMSDTLATGETVPYAFWPGQIRMPATWNRYGNPSGTIGEDWPRVLAHELGHYALFLLDNYLGIDDNGFLIQTDCAGSAMTDAYRQEYSEFLASPANSAGYGWTGDCLQTMAAKTTGRSDWETIQTFYPLPNTRLNSTQTGPLSLPIAVTRVTTVPPTNPANPLPDPFIYLVDEQGQALTAERGTAAGYLFQTQGTSDPSDDVITALGSPVGNLLQARGLASGDRVCLYTSGATPRVGCLANANPFNTTLLVPPVADWQPQISVQPVNSTTLAITVTQVSGVGPLQVQIYPSYRPTSTVQAVTGNLTTVSPGVYATSLQFPMTIFHGYARVWVAGSNPLKEAIVPFSITPGWDGNAFSSWGGNAFMGWDGNAFSSWGGNAFSSWGGNAFSSWGAPISSADGQVILFNTDDILGGNAATVLQVLNSPPNLPPWLTVVGQAYRYDTNAATGGDNFVIQFQYLERELSALPESELRVYYLDDSDPQVEWQRLVTTIDDFRNLASAKMMGKGVYALVATVELPRFYIGWNNFSYPIYETRPVSEGLASVAGAYTSVYQYEAQDQRWRLYDATVVADYPAYASLVNDLEVLEFGRAYWLYATQVITPYLGVQPDAAVVNTWPNFPPATYFGPVTADVPLTAGTAVEAVINGQVCGQGVLQNLGGQLVYKVQVRADNGDGCGDFGRQLTIRVAGQAVGAVTNWDNGRAHYLPLALPKLYLPFVQRLP